MPTREELGLKGGWFADDLPQPRPGRAERVSARIQLALLGGAVALVAAASQLL